MRRAPEQFIYQAMNLNEETIKVTDKHFLEMAARHVDGGGMEDEPDPRLIRELYAIASRGDGSTVEGLARDALAIFYARYGSLNIPYHKEWNSETP